MENNNTNGRIEETIIDSSKINYGFIRDIHKRLLQVGLNLPKLFDNDKGQIVMLYQDKNEIGTLYYAAGTISNDGSSVITYKFYKDGYYEKEVENYNHRLQDIRKENFE